MQPIFDKIKIGFLGSSLTGKTLIVLRFANKELPQNQSDHESTIEDRYSTSEMVGGVNTTIELLDTAGDEEYQTLLDMWINYAEGFALVFSIDNKKSFEALKQKYDKIIRLKGYSCPLLLIGNKKDLESEREVTVEEAKKMASFFHCEYVEMSALNNENCKEPLMKLADLIINNNRKQQEVLQRKRPLPQTQSGFKCSCINLPCTIF